MAKLTDARFVGASGVNYNFEVYSTDAVFNELGAIYIFGKWVQGLGGSGVIHAIYIGQTEELNTRIANHDKWPCVLANNANCICVLVENSSFSRLSIETDLRSAIHTPCNEQ